MSDVFHDAAVFAITEAGDPTQALAAIDEPAKIARRPQQRAKRVAWAASQIAAHGESPARAYKALRELLAALFEPLAGAPRQYAPAPEIAITLSPAALVDALCAPPRVLAPELAKLAQLDPRALLADAAPARRVLGIRALAPVASFAGELANAIVLDDDPAVRAEALQLCTHASQQAHEAVANALRALLDDPAREAVRAAVIDALHALHAELAPAQLAPLLADPVAAVRAAAARSLGRVPAELANAVVQCLGDDDAFVRAAALGAVSRSPALLDPAGHGAALVEPLRAILRHDHDMRAAVYLLGKLAGVDARVVPALSACVLGPRSDVATAATLVLRELGVDAPAMAIEDRLARASRELASRDAETYASGVQEARRLGPAARTLVPALRALGDALASADTVDARAQLAQVRELLGSLGVPAADMPRAPSRLEGYGGQTPTELSVHGAYTIATIGAPIGATGLWDSATGKRLFVVDRAVVFDFIAGRAEVAVVAVRPSWMFERYAIPSGALLGSIAIADAFTHGVPAAISTAADLATVWCDDARAPYRFHVKLGDPDRVIDDAPVLGRRPRPR